MPKEKGDSWDEQQIAHSNKSKAHLNLNKNIMETLRTWSKAINDPHLIPLGYFLVWVEEQAGWGWGDADHLEKTFMRDPWLNWVQVVLVVNPEGFTKPFALLCGNPKQPHFKCPFFNVTGGDLKV